MINAPGFTPFFAVVENVNDPEKNGRVQARAYGYNSPNRGILPTEALHWFRVGVPNSSGTSGLGDSPTGYSVGSLVFGYYLDEDLQEGVIIMGFPGAPGGSNDVNSLATGEGGGNLVSKRSSVARGVPDSRGGSWDEPETPYAAVYPDNRVFATKSGHIVEYDDTPGAERISIFHKSGTFEETHPDGKKVYRNVKDKYEMDLSNNYLLVTGNCSTRINGDYRLDIGGEFYVKSKQVTFDTPEVLILGNSVASDHISSGVSGKFHLHTSVMIGNSLSGVPFGMTTEFMPSPANSYNLETEDTGYTPEVIQKGVDEGFLTPEDVKSIETEKPVEEPDTKDDAPPPENDPKIVECPEAFDSAGNINYNVLLSEGVTLRQVSIGAVVSNYAIKAQGGLTAEQIVCNLKNLAENVITPLKKQYPNAMVTSGFRTPAAKSQHTKGEAVDIQFKGLSNRDYYNVAVWIKNNLPFDQLLLEFKSTGTRMPWIHVSLKKDGTNRKQCLTLMNHKTHSQGLVNLIN